MVVGRDRSVLQARGEAPAEGLLEGLSAVCPQEARVGWGTPRRLVIGARSGRPVLRPCTPVRVSRSPVLGLAKHVAMQVTAVVVSVHVRLRASRRLQEAISTLHTRVQFVRFHSGLTLKTTYGQFRSQGCPRSSA